MLNQRDKTAGDYAVIALAPMLVFLMISSLANFLMLVIYRGGQPSQVSWTMLMFTLGAVAIARVAIEKSRMYSLGYALALGAVSFFAMVRFVDSLIATVMLLGLVAFLADWVIRDCTLIDESSDSSDRGLIDSQGWIKRLLQSREGSDSQDDKNATARKAISRKATSRGGQPGRSVLCLAFAALPLYGLGQFFIRSDPGTWARAQTLLAFYLFAAIALLVTTSFLGLRRYLRQRGADMPSEVAVSWLGGGLAIIALILFVAFMVPVPGRAIASLQLPEYLDSPGDTAASKFGWGEDAADRAEPDAASTQNDQSGKEKEAGSSAVKKGAKAGDVGDGDRKDGPKGSKQGGEKKDGSKGDQKEKSKQQKQNQPSVDQPKPEQQNKTKDPSQQQSQSGQNDANETRSNPSSESEPSPVQKIADSLPGATAVFQAIIFLVLAGVIAFFLFINRHALADFWNRLFQKDDDPADELDQGFEEDRHSAPRRSFSSYRRPDPSGNDPRQTVVVSFAALDAWCYEAGLPRGKDETPSEFLDRLQRSHASMSEPARQVIAAYNRIVYGRGVANIRDVRSANELWDLMIAESPSNESLDEAPA